MALDLVHVENRVTYHDQPIVAHDFRAELLHGLQQRQKAIAPKFFYDARGSELFEAITRQPEYYPTRTEMHLLQEYSTDIAAEAGQGCVLIEPGSGSSEKVELLLPALRPAAYVPVEISQAPLHAAAGRLTAMFPWLQVHAVCADYTSDVNLPAALPVNRRIVFYPGSTIGNFEPADAVQFLRRIGKLCANDGGLLIGVDLQKDPAILRLAYNDAEGVTAAFNLNVLQHINRVAGANFEPSAFSHHAVYNSGEGRIEMYLESKQQQRVNIAAETIELAAGERILTEYSYKYTVGSFQQLARLAGFEPVRCWTDRADLFSVHFLEVAGS